MSSILRKNLRNITMLKLSNGRISMHFNYQIIFDRNTGKESEKNVSGDLGV